MKNHSLGLIVGSIGGFAACLLVVGVAGCKRGGSDVIATVNGEPITTDDYYKYLENKVTVKAKLGDGSVQPVEVAGNLGFQAMEDLIGQTATLQLAKDQGIYPTEDDVNKELEFKKKLAPNFLTMLTTNGLTLEMIRKSLVLDLVQERLITKDVKVTTDEAKKYIADHPEEFKSPKRVDMSWIYVRDAHTRAKVDQELEGGQSFSAVALRYSEANDAKVTSGRFVDSNGQSWVFAALPKVIQGAVGKFSGGERTDWITIDASGGQGKFLINKVIPETTIVMDDSKTEFLRRKMAKDKGAKSKDVSRLVLAKLKDSKVDVQRQQYQQPWKDDVKRMEQQNKMESLTGSAGN